MKKTIIALSMIALCLFCVSTACAQSNQTYKWTGFYVGLNAGYGFGGNNGWDFEPFDILIPAVQQNRVAYPSYNPKGFLGGLQAGCDYQISDRLLVGIETDFQYSDIKDKNSASIPASGSYYPETTTIKQEMNWFGTTRLRFGVFPTQRLLIYGTGGLAYGELKASSSISYDTGAGFNLFGGSSKERRVGHTMGGGLEFALTKKITVKGEYLYYDLGKNDVDMVSITWPVPSNSHGSFTTRGNIVRMGVNYRF